VGRPRVRAQFMVREEDEASLMITSLSPPMADVDGRCDQSI
jgi:hypothetical protein